MEVIMKRSILTLAVLAALSSGGAIAHEDDAAAAPRPGEKLGTVMFETSCAPAVAGQFNRAMALWHSFWFDPSADAFRAVAADDPACGMAHWGLALTRLGNPFAWPPSDKQMQGGRDAIRKAQEIGAKTQRERDYIDALARFYDDTTGADHRARAVAFEQAMGQITQRYPDDVEAKILYALMLDATALPTDKTYAQQLKAGAMLEAIWEQRPDHPGVAHFIIHSYDYPELADKALAAARRYAAIAPSAPHALHMPGHIFTRLGYWDESIETNRMSAEVAKAELDTKDFQSGSYNALHAMDYMVYAYLQQGQDAHARALVDEMGQLTRVDVEIFPAAFAFAASPARYALEHGDWEAASRLELKPTGLSWQKFPQAEAVLVFARSLGAARSGKLDVARAGIERLGELNAALVKAKQPYWAEQAAIQQQIGMAWVQLAEGRKDEALRTMRAAADREDATDKHPVTPGPLAPARELLGEMLLMLDRPADALAEFERSQQKEPNRLRGFYGAARAAALAGQQDVAKANYQKLLELTAPAEGTRKEIEEARSFVGQG
jgi:tetratricopeptide (TPR) repeat protein